MKTTKILKLSLKHGCMTLAVLFAFSVNTLADDFYNRLKTQRVESDSTIIWEQVSPGNSGFANLLRYHPSIPGKVAFCQDMWNHYQTDNNGLRWYSTVDHDGDASFSRMLDLEYSPSDPKLSIAIATSELWMSQDTGRTFTMVPNCPWYKKDTDGGDKESWKKKVAAVGIDPNNADIWFVAGGSNVRGQDWMSCYQDVTSANPRGESALNEGKLYRTLNAGKSWTTISTGLDAKAQVGRIIVNPKNSQQVFASSNYGVYKSVNGGTSWAQVSEGKLDNNIIMDMDFYYHENTGKFVLYVIDQVHYVPDGTTTKSTGGIFRSDDEGNTWTKINGNLGLDYNRITGGAPNNYYKYIAKWLNISESVAKSTYPDLPSAGLQYFNMLDVDPSREGALYIGFADPQVANSIVPGRLWTTTNDGQKWISTARLYEHVWENDSVYWKERGNPWHENMVVGHQSPHMQSGNNYALRSMRGLSVGVDGSVMIISDHSTMLSTDHGATWHQVDEDYTPSGAIVGRGNSNLPALTIGQDKRNDHMVLGSGEHYVWIPTDDSPNKYQAIKYSGSSQPSVISLAFNPYDSETVYATSSRQENKQYIFRSTDGGYNWSKWGVATPATNKWLDDFYTNALSIDPINPQYMYHGITNIVDENKVTQGGFFRSTDGGKTFTQSNSGLPSPVRARDIQFDPRDETHASLFLAAEYNNFNYHLPVTSKAGLYHSSDRGLTWQEVNTPSAVKGVNKIKIDHTNRLYITTGYRGSGSGVWYTDDFGATWNQIFKYEGAECIDVSPYDHNFLVVTYKHMSKNPGVFVSRDRGLTWSKSNIGIVIPQEIEDIEFHVNKPDEIWLATKGTGFYKGRIKNGKNVQVVKVTPKNIDYRLGSEKQLHAEIVNSNFSGERLTWKSENPSIVKVDQHGRITPVGLGNTKVWASAVNGRYTDYSVVVIHELPIDSVGFEQKHLELDVNTSARVTFKVYPQTNNSPSLTWKSLSPELVEVSNTGKITALKGGSAQIVAHLTADTTMSDTLMVKVNEQFVESILLNHSLYKAAPGEFIQLRADVFPDNAYDNSIKWKTGNSAIAMSFSGGKFYAAANGETFVLAYNERSGISDTCIVMVGDFTPVNKVIQSKVRLAPSPASQRVSILGIPQNTTVNIFALNGQKVMQTQHTQNMDISQLKPGTYIVEIPLQGQKTTLKLVKK